MGIATAITAIGVAAGAVGTGLSYSASQRQEAAIKKQNEMENDRRKRQAYREALGAMAMSEAAAANQGGLGGSGLQGGLAQAMSAAGATQSYSNQNLAVANQISDARSQANMGQMVGGIGGALVSLGGSVVNQQQRLNRLGYGSGYGN